MEKSRIVKHFIVGSIATTSLMFAGFNLAWPAPSLSKLLADDSDILITSDQSSWIVSSYSFGGMIGPLIGAAFVDRYGRKLCLLSTIIPSISSCILIGVAQSYWWFVVARFIAGAAMGVTFIALPMYLGEIAEDRIRGALGVMLNFTSNTGVLLTYCVGPWVSREALAVVGGVLPLIFGLMFVWLPESPYFLIMTDKPDCAEKSLLWLRGTGSVSEELRQIRQTVEFDQKNAGSMKDLVMTPENRKVSLMLHVLAVAQNFSGISAILAYSGLIFEASGSTLDSSISVIIVGVVQLFSAILAVFTVDLAGRRPLLLISCGGTILFLGGEALYFYLQSIGTDVSPISWLPVTSMIGYIISFVISLGCVPHVIISEILPCNIKASGTMACTVFSALLGIIITKLYQVIADAFGIHVSFLGFVVLTACSSIAIYFTIPETKQRSLKNIQEELHKSTESKIVSVKSDAA